MQLFLMGYIIISICEIFTIGWFPLSGTVRIAFTAIHIASIVATLWILLMNAVVGYQILDDGTIASIGLIFGSAAALFVGTGYIALDTGFAFTNYWQDTVTSPTNRAYALYTLYQLVPLIFIVVFFILEAVLVLRVLGEVRPMCRSPEGSKSCWEYVLIIIQCTLLLLPFSSPSVRSSSTLLASTSAMARTAPSTAAFSRPYSPCSLSS
jgi:hypothetical protein